MKATLLEQKRQKVHWRRQSPLTPVIGGIVVGILDIPPPVSLVHLAEKPCIQLGPPLQTGRSGPRLNQV
eukprot:5730955-Prorocentrum_lima.AAC.1